jgi:O-antigen/teichoic acid export membrane protein
MKSVYANIVTLIKKETLRANLTRSAVGSLFIKVSYILLSFAVGVALARLLGAKGYGVYTYVFTLLSLLSIPVQLGLPNLVVRETAGALAKGKFGIVRGVWHWAGRVTAVNTVILVLAAGVVALILGGRFSGEQMSTFAWGLLLVPLLALGNIRGAALRGLHKVIYGQIPEFVLRPGFFLVILGMAFLFSSGKFSPTTAMVLHVLAAALSFIIGAWLLLRETPMEVRYASPDCESRRWRASMLPLALTANMQFMYKNTDILMLGIFTTAAEVGIYRVAVQVSLLVSFGLQAINTTVAPQFAKLYALGDKVQLQKVVTDSASASMALALPQVAVILLFGEPLLNYIFGTEFAVAYTPLTILALGQIVNSAMGPVGFLLNMTGYERETARWVVVSAVGNIVLNLILISLLGINGAAIATTITVTVRNVLLWRTVSHRLGINSMAFNLFGSQIKRNI